jgi:prevent-host-death family protein
MEATMIDITKDIQPLTTFRNNSVKFMKRLKKTPRPIILTVNGKPEAVVQSAAEYQRRLDIAVSADVNEGIRQGLEDMREGRTRPADEVFEEMRRKYAMSR